MGLFVHELIHLLLTLAATGITLLLLRIKNLDIRKLTVYVLTGAFLGEFFLDTDHLFDYLLAFGFSFNLKAFLHGKMFEVLHKTYVIFHAWEWIIVLWVIIYFTKKVSIKYFLLAMSLGILFHLTYDTFYSHFYFQGYSIIFRLLHGFNPKYFSFSSS